MNKIERGDQQPYSGEEGSGDEQPGSSPQTGLCSRVLVQAKELTSEPSD